VCYADNGGEHEMPSALGDWAKIIRDARPLLEMANKLLPNIRRTSSDSAMATDVQVLRQRLSDLEHTQQEAAKLLTQLTDHVQSITLAAQASATLARRTLLLAVVSGVLGIVACVLAALR
jgi:uncharacterized protein involved in exopolysaccharide biosynthesis